tara:strand:- start:437 stop:781 length:345 start_codon:yes stop_codon:yes gene_type:complete
MKKLHDYINLKKLFLLLAFLPISLVSIGQSQEYSSLEEVKKLNFELFEEIGLDENKMNHVCRAIYSTQKKASYLAENGVFPNKEKLDLEFKSLLLRGLSEEEFKKFESIKHKIK